MVASVATCMNITEPLRRSARLNPTAVAVVRADHTSVSYRAFDRMIDAAARSLALLGIVAGQTVGLAIAGPDEFAGLIVALALARLGVASADLALPAERMDACIIEGGRADKPGTRSLAIDAVLTGMTPADALPVTPYRDGSAVFRIFASSGTVGTPSFSAVSHDLMAARVTDSWLAIGRVPAVQICAIGMGITWGCTRMLRTFWTGGTLVLTNPREAVASIRRHQVNALAIAPISLQQVLAAMPAGAVRPPSLEMIEVGGSALPARLGAMVRQKLCDTLFSHFGATETGGIASGPLSGLGHAPGAVGYVHAGMEVQAVDADDRPLPPDTEGLLRIRGANVIAGYFGDEAASARVFRDGWFYCGDIGAVSPDGLLTVSGRDGDFINAGGNKLSPRVVEDVLLSLPQVKEAAAFGVPDRMGVVQIWAAIVPATPVEMTVLQTLCRDKLAEKAPKYIIQMQGLPRNANGKIIRTELIKFATERQP
jgi:acyl-coenzyme A synthetase/AMP-(fatty) acid ligase